MLHIVLYQPEIPANTGNIGRLCVANDWTLHLIRPLAFAIDDAQVRRAGLDYWQYLSLPVHDSWEDFLAWRGDQGQIYMLSTKVSRPYWSVDFQAGDYLVFGSETRGLPADMLASHGDQALTIPMSSTAHARSLNLANSVSIVAYEAYRQISLAG